MQTKKSYEIPEEHWGGVPNLGDWIDGAKTARKEAAAQEQKPMAKQAIHTVKTNTFKPMNDDHLSHFHRAKGKIMLDVGLNDNCIVLTLDSGELTFDFVDKTLMIDPHANGGIIDYHIVNPTMLVDTYAFVPNSGDGRNSCVLVIKGENQNLEYLIRPALTSNSLAFYLEYEDQNA